MTSPAQTVFDLTGKRVYVAGHRGMVGSALVRALTSRGYANLVLRSHAQLDLTDQAATTTRQERLIATLTLVLFGLAPLALSDAPWMNWIWMNWSLGVFSGTLLTAPLVLLFAQGRTESWKRAQLLEAATVLVCLVTVGLVVFCGVPIKLRGYPLELAGLDARISAESYNFVLDKEVALVEAPVSGNYVLRVENFASVTTTLPFMFGWMAQWK